MSDWVECVLKGAVGTVQQMAEVIKKRYPNSKIEVSEGGSLKSDNPYHQGQTVSGHIVIRRDRPMTSPFLQYNDIILKRLTDGTWKIIIDNNHGNLDGQMKDEVKAIQIASTAKVIKAEVAKSNLQHEVIEDDEYEEITVIVPAGKNIREQLEQQVKGIQLGQ